MQFICIQIVTFFSPLSMYSPIIRIVPKTKLQTQLVLIFKAILTNNYKKGCTVAAQ